MRHVLVIAFASLAVAGCGGAEGALEGDCMARFAWDGVEYGGVGQPRKPVAVGERLGPGAIRGCPGGPETKVTVHRLVGIDPEVAVGLLDPSSSEVGLWGRPEYVVEHPAHPLHDAVYLSPDKPDDAADQSCAPPRTLRVRVLAPQQRGGVPLQVAALRPADREFLAAERVEGFVNVDAHTRITGADRHGIPFLGTGARIRLTVRDCHATPAAGPGMAGLRRLLAVTVAR